MPYNKCGESGLKLPAVSLGLWHNFGDTGNFDQMKNMCLTAFDNGITHFDLANNEWLYSKHDHIIDRCLRESDVTKQRLMLNLLLRQPFDKESIRTDFIDYCLERLADPDSSYAVRAQCIKLAYEQMRHWTELLGELRLSLDALSREPLSPGLRSARNQVLKKMSKD